MTRTFEMRILVALAAMLSLGVAITFDASRFASDDVSLVQEYSENVRNIQQPFLLFSIASLCGFVSAVVGAVLFLLRKRMANRFLIAAFAFTLASFPMVNVYVDSSTSAAASFIYAVSLGWLVGVGKSALD
ncbi:MAG: hypothetical protein OEW68_16600 [Gammaproteobacteria bacterium]|nr:hypothetical protein [Gammaproteobacteria bacterium]